MSRRLRVLHMVQNLNYGGMERVIADLLRGLDPVRFDPHLLVLQYLGRFSEGLASVAGLHQAPQLSRWSMLRPRVLGEYIAKIEPDLVHTHSGVWYKGVLAARAARVRNVVHTEHGRKSPDPWSDRWIDRHASRHTDVVVAVSPPLQDHLRTSVVVPRCRVELIPNGIDVDLFRPRSDSGVTRAELGLAASTPVLGSIGRLEAIKGYEVMIQAFAHLLRGWTAAPRPVLVLVGDGSERARLTSLALSLGVNAEVRFMGWRDDVQDFLATFTLFTMSSHSEGTSVSLLEAMSSGLCPVVTDVGGNRAVLGSDLARRLVAPGDPSSLASAWANALHDDEGRRADGRAARERVVGSYGTRSMVGGYERLYADLSDLSLSAA